MNMHPEVRFATITDAEKLSATIATVIQSIPYYNELAKQTEVAKFKTTDVEQKLLQDPQSAIIAIIDSKVVGFCLSRFDDYTIWLEWFGVVREYRRKGVAHLLLNELDKTVAARDCHKIWCDCRISNSATISILTAHNYRQLVTIYNHWYGQDFILWEKSFRFS